MKTQTMEARTFGVFFILAFVSYGLGTGLTESITNAPDMLENVYANKNQFVIGIILMALVHSFVNIGLATIMFPILKPYNRYLAYGYFSAAIVATTILIIGTIFLLLLIPLSDEYMKVASDSIPNIEHIALICKKGGYFAYQIGMALWGIGGLMFCVLLFKSKLVPQIFPAWGLVGYVIFISGTIAELFGYPIGVLLSLPGGLFEISLSLWLIGKGLNLKTVDYFEDTNYTRIRG